MYKHEIEAQDKAIEKRVREKSIADTKAKHNELAKKTGISKKKIQHGHGSGPLTRDELDKIKKAEGGSSVSRKPDTSDEKGRPKSKIKHKILTALKRRVKRAEAWANE